ncbi:hypothetical protein SM094_000775 [Cronobacter malonaticus]|nr:hypothetical protein [Cronobacter malonaticus]
MNKRLLWGITFVIALMFLLYAAFLIHYVLPKGMLSIGNAGTFGDSFGVLTSLFSALAFIGVLLTYASQKEESQLQKIELQESRKEYKKQGFESTFFQLLKQHADFIKNLAPPHTSPPKDGRDVMREITHKLTLCLGNSEVPACNPEEKVLDAFKELYKEEGDRLSHYLGVMKIMLRFLSESELERKDIYVELILAQLYAHELYIIYYYALTPPGKELKKYIEEFKLMKSIASTSLYNPQHANIIPSSGIRVV